MAKGNKRQTGPAAQRGDVPDAALDAGGAAPAQDTFDLMDTGALKRALDDAAVGVMPQPPRLGDDGSGLRACALNWFGR